MTVKKERGVQASLSERVGCGNWRYSPCEVGRIAEAAIFLRLTLRRLNVLKPSFEGDKADWVVWTPETQKFVRLQVKACVTQSTGLPLVSLRQSSNSTRYAKEDFDFIVGYDLFTDTAYVWTSEEVSHLKAAVTICPGAAEAWWKISGLGPGPAE